MLFTSLGLSAVECGSTEQDGKVFTLLDCPSESGQYSRCMVGLETDCCDSINAESCDDNQD